MAFDASTIGLGRTCTSTSGEPPRYIKSFAESCHVATTQASNAISEQEKYEKVVESQWH